MFAIAVIGVAKHRNPRAGEMAAIRRSVTHRVADKTGPAFMALSAMLAALPTYEWQ
ncbi:hypothetical protein [Endozoicomonas ascidiicola]|uniref:hypothetical protein n=1 Tax=Endozoicomonas ascidiicola TaxID=1698521 RepID=UPI000AB05832|nr:hypothetical protein [Endozoicomonas ascidiicola]